jgi:hypothetical protein
MTGSSSDIPHHDLQSVVTHAEAEAQRLLRTAGTAPLDVVAWLSAHVAALDRAVYPVAKKSLPDGGAIVKQHREIIDRLARNLRVIERHQSGDVLASGLNSDRMLAELRALVDEHVIAETQLVERLVGALSDAAQSRLIASYETALSHAPTRPHPHIHRGIVMFRLDGMRDRILDAMDGRHVPLPKVVKPHVALGRWGAYFLGQPHDQSRDVG